METNKISVRIDMDSVLNRFEDHFCEVHYEWTGVELVINGWDLHHDSPLGKDVYKILESPDFFLNIPVQEGSDKLFMYLENNSSLYDYKVVSSYYGDSDRAFDYIYGQKVMWLKKQYSNSNDIIDRFTLVQGGKEEYPADVIIDDNLDNLTGENDTGNNIKIFYPAVHNKDTRENIDDPTIITSVKEMSDVIDILRDIALEGSINNYLENKLNLDI